MNGRLETPRDPLANTGPAAAARVVMPGWFRIAGQALLFAFIVLRLYTDKPGDYAGQLLVLFSLVGAIRFRHPLRDCFPAKLFLLALAAQLVTWGLALLLSPGLAESSPKVERLASWFFCIPVAMFAVPTERSVLAMWGSALAVLLLSPWLGGDGWEEIREGLAGTRVEFGLINSQHAGLLFGLCLLGLLVFMPRFSRFAHRHKAGWLVLGYTALLLVTLVVVIISQTRAIWLGLCFSLLVTGILYLRSLSAERRRNYLSRILRIRWRTQLVLASVALMLLVVGGEIVLQRLTHQAPDEVRELVREGKIQKDESIRVRLYTWREAAHWIVQRPLFGWGGHGRSAVVQATDGLLDSERERIRHLHSTYVGTLVNFGLAGLVLFLALLWWITAAVRRACQSAGMARDFGWFWLAFLLYWLVVNLFESYMYYQTGIYAFSLLVGGYLALLVNYPGPGKNPLQRESGAGVRMQPR